MKKAKKALNRVVMTVLAGTLTAVNPATVLADAAAENHAEESDHKSNEGESEEAKNAESNPEKNGENAPASSDVADPEKADNAKEKQESLNEKTGNTGYEKIEEPVLNEEPAFTEEEQKAIEEENAAAEKKTAEINAEKVTPVISEAYQKAAEDAETASELVDAVEDLKEKLPETLDTAEEAKAVCSAVNVHNENVQKDQETVDKETAKKADQVVITANGTTVGGAKVETSDHVENREESGSEKTELMVDEYAKKKADDAREAAEKTKEALDKALSVDTDTVDLTKAAEKGEEALAKAQAVHDAVDEANTAAAAAVSAVSDIKKVVDRSRKNLKDSVDTYNRMAEKYGLTGRYVENENGKFVFQADAVSAEEAAQKKDIRVYDAKTAKTMNEDIAKAAETLDSTEAQNAITKAADKIIDSQKSMENAEKLYSDAKSAAGEAVAAAVDANVASILSNVTAQQKVLDALEKPMQGIRDRADAAKSRYDETKEELDEIRAKLNKEQNRNLLNSAVTGESLLQASALNLNELQKKIEDAEARLQSAEKELNEANAAKAVAENFKKWADSLLVAQKTFFSAQTTKENSTEYAYLNDREYDENGNVVGRPTSHFIHLHNELDQDERRDIPYILYRQYVKYAIATEAVENGSAVAKEVFQYDHLNKGVDLTVNGQKIKNETSGKGISLKPDENPACNTWIYWKVIKDENGKVILPTNEEYYVSKADGSPSDEMESGLYFVGYVLKRQKDSYHYDGYLFEYEKPEEPTSPSEEPTNPSEEPTNPSEEPTNPSEEPTNPSEEPTNPSEEPTNPSEEPTSPSEEPTSPSEGSTDPAEEPTNASEEPATITPAVPESGGNGGSSPNGSGSSGSGSSGSGSSHSSGSRGGSNHISLSVVQPAIPQSAAETAAESEPLTEITGAVPMAPATGISTPVPMDGASPQTGDDRQMFMWEAISALSAAALGAYWVIRRKHSRKEG
ncbi:hypothetical protein [[Clostridium] aminophilum]|uniref:hypothetical protein n=1 Tax=[Clostridium] aminophilum TaxID=1526 RepID=UPI00068FECFA|nr:hypothetical protein [[Clostridium] aminophilum]